MIAETPPGAAGIVEANLVPKVNWVNKTVVMELTVCWKGGRKLFHIVSFILLTASG